MRSPFKTTAASPVIKAGTIVLNSTGDSLNFDLGGDPLVVRLAEGEVLVSAVIRGNDGVILGEIKDNIWRVVPSKTLDRNFNDNTLEIIDAKGDVIFQIQILGEEVAFACYYYTKSGRQVHFEPWLHEIQGRKGSLFKYPSDQFPHGLKPIGSS